MTLRNALPFVVALASLAMLTSAFTHDFALVQTDEARLAWTGKLVTLGRVPYRDFFEFAPPLAIYGTGLVTRVAGEGLVPLRIVSIAWLTLCTLLLYIVLRGRGASRAWAAAGALLLPGLIVPFWPAASFHWFAMGLGLSALACIRTADAAMSRWFVAGFMAALAGLVIQPMGVVFTVMLGLALLHQRNLHRPAAALALGIALPLLLCVLLLLAAGNLGDAIWSTVVWPARYYRQPGGSADIGLLEFFQTSPLAVTKDPLVLASFLLLAMLPLILAAILLTSPQIRMQQMWARIRGIASALAFGMILLLFLRGRPDWTHLVFLMPVLLVMLCMEVDWKADMPRTRVVRAWLSVALLTVGIRWTAHWLSNPPAPRDVLVTDAVLQQRGVLPVVDELPGARAGNQPIVYLGHRGSTLYLYWSPVPPPVNWVLPPTIPDNSPREYVMLARFIEEQRIPWIVIPEKLVDDYFAKPSALRDVLQNYRPVRRTSRGVAYQRIRA